MGNYDCRGASIVLESRKSQFLWFICCHLWGEWKRLLYLLLREKRPLLYNRKSSTFWQLPNQSRSSFKPSSGTYAGFVILLKIKPISEGILSPKFRNAHFTSMSTFPFAEMLLREWKAQNDFGAWIGFMYHEAHLSLRFNICIGELLLKYCNSRSSS